MKNKKVIALVLGMAMIVSTLAGCGSSETQKSSEAKSTSSSKEESQKPSSSESSVEESEAEPVSYTYTIGKDVSGPAEEDCAVEVYWEERLGHEFEIMYYETDQYSELLNIDIASGDAPDVFSAVGRTKMESYYNQGVIGGFSKEFLKEHAPLIYETIESELGDAGFDVVTIDGLMYSLPYLDTQAAYEPILVWNTDWLEAVGFDGLPTTLEEFEEVLTKFVTEDPDGNGKDDTYGFSNSMFNLFYGAFGCTTNQWVMQDDGTLAYGLMQEGFKDALAWLAKMYAAGVIDPEYVTGENTGGYWAISNKFAEGRIGLTGYGSFYHWPTKAGIESGLVKVGNATPKLIEEMGTGMNYAFGNHPVGPDGDYGGKNGATKPMSYCVFSAELVEDEERFIALLQSIEYMSGLHDKEDGFTSYLGLKGVNWDYDEHGQPVTNETVDTIEKITGIGANGLFLLYFPGQIFKTSSSNRFNWIDGEYADLQVKNIDYVAFYEKLPSEELYLAELKTLFSETITEIITGAKPVDYYDEMVKKAKTMGYDTLAEEAMEAYNNGRGY